MYLCANQMRRWSCRSYWTADYLQQIKSSLCK